MKDELVLILDEEARRTDAEGVWPERSIQTLAKSGLLGLTLPTDAGAAAGMREFADVTQKIAKHCASTAMIYLMHICASQVIAASSSPRKTDLLQRITSGTAIGTLAFSEKILQQFPGDVETRSARIDVFLKNNQEAKARTELDALAARMPQARIVQYYRALFQIGRAHV